TPMRQVMSKRPGKTLMKLVVDQPTQRVLGVHLLGDDVPEMMQGIGVAMTAGATKQDFDRTIGIHPTSAEEFVTMRTRTRVAGELLGILSERDIVACLAENGPRTLEMTAAQLMTAEVQTASPRMTVDEAMGLMTAGRFRHIPVVDEGRLVGLVSIGDVVKAKISDAEQEVDSLRAYVAGAA